VTEVAAFKTAVRRLHAEKDAAYGPAWKRRGELISVLANLARKVDRLEQVAAGAPVTRDENVLDTAVDLLVYALKYQTYLADQDTEVAAYLVGTVQPPYSDGRSGFEALLDALDLTELDDAQTAPGVTKASAGVVAAFNELERCFAEPHAPTPAGERLKRAITLTAAATQVVAALCRETPALYRDFLAAWGRDT
jgi:hypothetical protein